MGTETTNYNLYKPTKDEIDWDDEVNSNFDTIDSELKKKEAKVNGAKVDSPNLVDADIEFDVTGSTITAQLSTELQAKVDNGETAHGWGNHADSGYEATANKNQANGYAGLNADSKVPLANLEQIGGITFGADNAEEVIETGELPFGDYAVKSGTITKAYVKCYVSSTVTVDIYVNGSKISASAPLTITAGTSLTETTFTGWTKTISAGDYITANVTANDNATKLLVKLITE